ncbi:MAG: inositol monophosphatase [Anaerolineales bacterium]|nr:inositol monophosphatase [Anaerolineales bacterium]
MPPILDDLEDLARQAGEILRVGFGREKHVFHKSEIDLVTDVDRRAEELILRQIQRRFPGDRIIAEESGDLPGRDCCTWYVDPLDGTVNFAHGVPIFSVSIGYAEQGALRLGVVYDPLQDECFRAELGAGAWLNGKAIRASDVRQLNQSLLVTGFPYDIRSNPENNLNLYARFALRSQGVRRLGSAALDLCYVAAGRFDGFWELRLSPWDLAAGALIASEAGATVSDLAGSPDYLRPPYAILAAAQGVYPQMLEVIQQA